MLIWKGWGLLALFIPLGLSLLIQFIVDFYFGSGFYKSASWPLPLAFLLSSLPIFYLGHTLNKKPGRKLMDLETQEIIELKEVHSFFWIPMQYCSLIAVVISILLYLSNIGFIYPK